MEEIGIDLIGSCPKAIALHLATLIRESIVLLPSGEALAVHLDKVAQSASTFAEAFGAGLWGEVLGRCHDLGKLSSDLQPYLYNAGLRP
jgi:hypothetical protein